jgi:8-oxo-dGTP pyrophosphatase MutT (NUDIX family)
MMISYETGTDKFQYRAGSIVIHNNKILMQRAEDSNLWFIPGGRVEFDETADKTIEREMMEEFGVTIIDKKLIWIIENFIKFPERRVHEIGMFFLVKLQEGHSIYEFDGDFQGNEEGFVNRWINKDDLDDYVIVPEFVVNELRNLDSDIGIKHVINRSVR